MNARVSSSVLDMPKTANLSKDSAVEDIVRKIHVLLQYDKRSLSERQGLSGAILSTLQDVACRVNALLRRNKSKIVRQPTLSRPDKHALRNLCCELLKFTRYGLLLYMSSCFIQILLIRSESLCSRTTALKEVIALAVEDPHARKIFGERRRIRCLKKMRKSTDQEIAEWASKAVGAIEEVHAQNLRTTVITESSETDDALRRLDMILVDDCRPTAGSAEPLKYVFFLMCTTSSRLQ